VETLTNQMEQEIEKVIAQVDAAGGMFKAVESGLVQRLIGDSALAFQQQVESGKQKIVGVNAFRVDEDASRYPSLLHPPLEKIEAQLAKLKAFKANRAGQAVEKALSQLAAAANDPSINVFGRVVEAAEAGATHGEICACLRREMGFGQPMVMV
jgi:methylmalonyl-CoA mutase N-terminal domain/subunit